jgi:hypothetical protein
MSSQATLSLLKYMEIKTSMNVSGVNGPTPSGRPAAPARKAGDTASFARSAAVEAALKSLPDIRPEAVDRAKQLISDPNYPPAATVKQLSQFLAANLPSENE